MRIDTTSLEQVRAWADRVIDLDEYHRQIAPLMKEFFEPMHSAMISIPDAFTESAARTYESLVSLEQSVSEFPERKQEVERDLEAALASARRRTAALRQWLEALS